MRQKVLWGKGKENKRRTDSLGGRNRCLTAGTVSQGRKITPGAAAAVPSVVITTQGYRDACLDDHPSPLAVSRD